MKLGLVKYKGVKFYIRDLYHINGEWIAVTETGEEILIDSIDNIEQITEEKDTYEEEDKKKHDIY